MPLRVLSAMSLCGYFTEQTILIGRTSSSGIANKSFTKRVGDHLRLILTPTPMAAHGGHEFGLVDLPASGNQAARPRPASGCASHVLHAGALRLGNNPGA